MPQVSTIRTYIVSMLILANLGSALTVPLVYLDFEVRKEYIQKVLCIKKDKPITVCGGSCYLAKRLSQTENTQDKNEPSTPQGFTFFSNIVRNISLNKQNILIKTITQTLVDEPFPGTLLIFDIYHPPQQA